MKKNFLLPIVLLLFSAAMGVLSPGFLEFDELTHVLKARELTQDWRVVLDIWGRPACTGLYGIAAAVGGVVAARLLAVAVTGVTGWGAMSLLEVVPRGESELQSDDRLYLLVERARLGDLQRGLELAGS